MAPNVTVSFFDPTDINGTPLLTITDEDDYFKGLKLQPDLYSVGGWQLTLARAWGFALLGSEAMQSEVFVRFLVHAYSDTDYFFGGVLNKKDLIVVDRDEIGAEELVIGGSGPKAYLERYRAGIEQLTGTGWNLDLSNGVWRFNENASAGQIINRFVAEDLAHSSPATPDLSRSFSSTHDSDGVAWTDDIATAGTYEVPIGESLLQIIWDLEDLSDTLTTTINLGTVTDPTYLLEAWQSYGSDVTGTAQGSGVCRIAEGVNIANDSLSVQGVAFRKATHVIVEGKDGTWVVEVKPTFSPGDFKKMAKIEYTRSSNEDILHKAGLRWLRRQDSGDQQFTVEIVPGDDEAAGYYFPGSGSVLWVGNTVTLDTTADGSVHSPLDYNNDPVLVTGLELELGPAGDETTADKAAKSWDVTVKLNHEREGFGGSPSQSSSGTDGGNGGGCKCPPLCHIDIPGDPPSESLTNVGQFNANSDGGDAILWSGTLGNQGPPGAGGSSHYYFSGGGPDQFQQVRAATAGLVYRVTGYAASVTPPGDAFYFSFFSSGVGVAGNPANEIVRQQLVPSAGSPWVAFSWDLTAPVGTVGWAFGKDGAVSFDQLSVDVVDFDPGTGGQEGDIPEPVGSDGASGDSARAARCDHVHEHGTFASGDLHTEYVREASTEWVDLTDGGATTLHSHSGGSAHTIKEDGTPLTARSGLNFMSGIVASDDAGNNETDVDLDWAEDADVSTQAFGDAAATGTSQEVARAGHKHGMPADPVTAHVAASDPHTGYLLESLLDAKGDLIAASANDTPAKVTVGSDGKVLVADSSATPGVSWQSVTAAGSGIVRPWFIVPEGGNNGNAAGTLGAANNGIFRPCVVPVDCSVTGIRLYIGTSSGLIDVALYDESFNRVASNGGVASPGTLIRTITFASSPVAITAGRYWLAVAANNNTVTFANALTNGSGGPGMARSQGTVYPLPNPAAPGSAEVAGTNNPQMILLINGSWP